MLKDERRKEYVLAIIKGLNLRLNNFSTTLDGYNRSELIKICWVIGYKEQATYRWKDIMNMPFLGMYGTRPYRKVLWKINQLKNLNRLNLKDLVEEASKYDPRNISVETRLGEVEMFHSEIHNDDLFEKSYRFLYKYQMKKYFHLRPELIKKRLYAYFGIIKY